MRFLCHSSPANKEFVAYQNVGAQHEAAEFAWHVSHGVPQACAYTEGGHLVVSVPHEENHGVTTTVQSAIQQQKRSSFSRILDNSTIARRSTTSHCFCL